MGISNGMLDFEPRNKKNRNTGFVATLDNFVSSKQNAITLDNFNGREEDDNNNKSRKNKNKKNQKRPYVSKREMYSKSLYTGSSYLPPDERKNIKENKEVDNTTAEIDEFCGSIYESGGDHRFILEQVQDELPEIVENIKKYYDIRNTPSFQSALNRLIKISCNHQFAMALKKTIVDDIWRYDDTYDRIFDSVGFLIAIAIETNHERMHSEVIRAYLFDVIPRIYGPEIERFCEEAGITNGLAEDLMIAIPVLSNDWNTSKINAFYARFLDKMIVHAEDNMDILNWEIQGILFDMIFGKKKTALKVIGQYLASEARTEFDKGIDEAVYNEFIKMIYDKLDDYDIDDIMYALRYVAKIKKEQPKKNTMFDISMAFKYENVKKAINLLMDEEPEMRNIFA